MYLGGAVADFGWELAHTDPETGDRLQRRVVRLTEAESRWLRSWRYGDPSRPRWKPGKRTRAGVEVFINTPSELLTLEGAAALPSFAAPEGGEGPERADAFTLLETVQKTSSEVGNEDLQGNDNPHVRDLVDSAVRKKVVTQLLRNGHEKEAGRLGGCTGRLGWKVCTKCGDGREHKSYCGLYHLCPTCARIRSRKLRAEVEYRVKTVAEVKGYTWKFLTFTIKTEKGQYYPALRRCIDGFAKVWKTVLKAPGAGAFRSIEFGPLNGNVHAHVLYYGPYIKGASLREEWERVTGGSYIVHIRAVKDKKTGKIATSADDIGMADALAEVTKYSTKLTTVGAKKLVLFWEGIKGSHLTQRYGVLRAVQTEKQLAEAPEKCACGCEKWFYVYSYLIKPLAERGPPHAGIY